MSLSISCGELEDAYVWNLQQAAEMVGGRKLSQISVVFADFFLKASFLNKLGIQDSCKLFWDHYHLKNCVWPDFFGTRNYSGSLKRLLEDMCHAASEESFDRLKWSSVLLSILWSFKNMGDTVSLPSDTQSVKKRETHSQRAAWAEIHGVPQMWIHS